MGRDEILVEMVHLTVDEKPKYACLSKSDASVPLAHRDPNQLCNQIDRELNRDSVDRVVELVKCNSPDIA